MGPTTVTVLGVLRSAGRELEGWEIARRGSVSARALAPALRELQGLGLVRQRERDGWRNFYKLDAAALRAAARRS